MTQKHASTFVIKQKFPISYKICLTPDQYEEKNEIIKDERMNFLHHLNDDMALCVLYPIMLGSNG